MVVFVDCIGVMVVMVNMEMSSKERWSPLCGGHGDIGHGGDGDVGDVGHCSSCLGGHCGDQSWLLTIG